MSNVQEYSLLADEVLQELSTRSSGDKEEILGQCKLLLRALGLNSSSINEVVAVNAENRLSSFLLNSTIDEGADRPVKPFSDISEHRHWVRVFAEALEQELEKVIKSNEISEKSNTALTRVYQLLTRCLFPASPNLDPEVEGHLFSSLYDFSSWIGVPDPELLAEDALRIGSNSLRSCKCAESLACATPESLIEGTVVSKALAFLSELTSSPESRILEVIDILDGVMQALPIGEEEERAFNSVYLPIKQKLLEIALFKSEDEKNSFDGVRLRALRALEGSLKGDEIQELDQVLAELFVSSNRVNAISLAALQSPISMADFPKLLDRAIDSLNVDLDKDSGLDLGIKIRILSSILHSLSGSDLSKLLSSSQNSDLPDIPGRFWSGFLSVFCHPECPVEGLLKFSSRLSSHLASKDLDSNTFERLKEGITRALQNRDDQDRIHASTDLLAPLERCEMQGVTDFLFHLCASFEDQRILRNLASVQLNRFNYLIKESETRPELTALSDEAFLGVLRFVPLMASSGKKGYGFIGQTRANWFSQLASALDEPGLVSPTKTHFHLKVEALLSATQALQEAIIRPGSALPGREEGIDLLRCLYYQLESAFLAPEGHLKHYIGPWLAIITKPLNTVSQRAVFWKRNRFLHEELKEVRPKAASAISILMRAYGIDDEYFSSVGLTHLHGARRAATKRDTDLEYFAISEACRTLIQCRNILGKRVAVIAPSHFD